MQVIKAKKLYFLFIPKDISFPDKLLALATTKFTAVKGDKVG